MKTKFLLLAATLLSASLFSPAPVRAEDVKINVVEQLIGDYIVVPDGTYDVNTADGHHVHVALLCLSDADLPIIYYDDDTPGLRADAILASGKVRGGIVQGHFMFRFRHPGDPVSDFYYQVSIKLPSTPVLSKNYT